jgi:hypothetical protein
MGIRNQPAHEDRLLSVVNLAICVVVTIALLVPIAVAWFFGIHDVLGFAAMIVTGWVCMGLIRGLWKG